MGGREDPVYPSRLERDVRTRSGLAVHVRPIRPADGPALVDFHARLSSYSVYLRFFSFHPVLSPLEVERFTHVDYVDRLALVVLDGASLVGVGRYDRLPGTTDAEVAFVVADAYQGEGIGTLLADDLATVARERGIERFVAETLPENSGMLDVFAGLGFPVSSRFADGVVRVEFPIEPVPSYARGLAEREAGRALGEPAGGEPSRRPC